MPPAANRVGQFTRFVKMTPQIARRNCCLTKGNVDLRRVHLSTNVSAVRACFVDNELTSGNSARSSQRSLPKCIWTIHHRRVVNGSINKCGLVTAHQACKKAASAHSPLDLAFSNSNCLEGSSTNESEALDYGCRFAGIVRHANVWHVGGSQRL